MKITNHYWSIRKLCNLKKKIDPRPQYQRGEVWKLPAKQLLMDSILFSFDIPKIYLHDCRGSGMYDYHVTDGQQRLNAIWGFCAGDYRLGDTANTRAANLIGLNFSELPKERRKTLLSFKLVTAIITDAAMNDVRELFSRLQRGSRLTPAELRNSLPSQIGDCVRAMAETHSFFSDDLCPFSPSRFKRHDPCAHAFLLELFGAEHNLKAPDLRQMYEQHARNVPRSIPKRVTRVLDYMSSMQRARPNCIRTKWGFVDIYLLVSQHRKMAPGSGDLAARFLDFEARRHQYTGSPKDLLIADGNGHVSPRSQRLYDYITAFQTSGSQAKNVKSRHAILKRELLKIGASARQTHDSE